jgi:GT2 family glycosyltransferase
MLEARFRGRVRWMQSQSSRGPGGGRNLLIRRATSPLVFSFDDDSWPLDKDYFGTAAALMGEYPRAGVLTGHVYLRGTVPAPRGRIISEVHGFENCASVFRRAAFEKTGGFMPLRYGYGMEEVDLALQLRDAGWSVLRTAQLRVFHDSNLSHHATLEINSAHITNTALLAFLRYPARYWFLGLAQVLNRVCYAASQGRFRGIGHGLAAIPKSCWSYAPCRKPVSVETIRRSRRFAHNGALADPTF